MRVFNLNDEVLKPLWGKMLLDFSFHLKYLPAFARAFLIRTALSPQPFCRGFDAWFGLPYKSDINPRAYRVAEIECDRRDHMLASLMLLFSLK